MGFYGPPPALTIAGPLTVTGAQQGATAPGGFTVPDTCTLFSYTPTTIPAVPGKSLTVRLVDLAASIVNSTASEVDVYFGVAITDVLTGVLIGQFGLPVTAPANGQGVNGRGVDMLGVSGSVGGALRVIANQIGANGSTGVTIIDCFGFCYTKAV